MKALWEQIELSQSGDEIFFCLREVLRLVHEARKAGNIDNVATPKTLSHIQKILQVRAACLGNHWKDF